MAKKDLAVVGVGVLLGLLGLVSVAGAAPKAKKPAPQPPTLPPQPQPVIGPPVAPPVVEPIPVRPGCSVEELAEAEDAIAEHNAAITGLQGEIRQGVALKNGLNDELGQLGGELAAMPADVPERAALQNVVLGLRSRLNAAEERERQLDAQITEHRLAIAAIERQIAGC